MSVNVMLAVNESIPARAENIMENVPFVLLMALLAIAQTVCEVANTATNKEAAAHAKRNVAAYGPTFAAVLGLVFTLSGVLGVGVILIVSATLWQVWKYVRTDGVASRWENAGLALTTTLAGMVVTWWFVERVLRLVERMAGTL